MLFSIFLSFFLSFFLSNSPFFFCSICFLYTTILSIRYSISLAKPKSRLTQTFLVVLFSAQNPSLTSFFPFFFLLISRYILSLLSFFLVYFWFSFNIFSLQKRIPPSNKTNVFSPPPFIYFPFIYLSLFTASISILVNVT